MRPIAAAVCTVAAVLSLASCAPQEVAPTEVVNRTLGVRLGPLPPGFKVVTNQGAVLELAPSAEGSSGTISFEVGPEDPSPNLLAAMKANRSRIETMAGGQYSGGQELQGPLGTAFYSRGRYQEGTTTIEETRVFTVHPGASRILTLVYRYPAGADSSMRVTQLLEIFALVDATQG